MSGWTVALALYVLGLIPTHAIMTEAGANWRKTFPLLALFLWPATIVSYCVCWPFRVWTKP